MRTWLRKWWSRLTAALAMLTVAGVTGRISYAHIYDLTLTLHQPVMVARLMPFGVDGLIVVGSVVLLQAAPVQEWWLGWIGVGPGVLVSVFANVESGIRYGALAAAWAGVPAVSFALSTFMFERWLKAQASQRAAQPGSSFSSPVPTDSESAAMLALHATLAAGNPLSGRQLETRFGLSRAQSTKVRDLVLAGSNGHLAPDGGEGSDQ